MLTRVAIKNFKSIGEQGVDIHLKPLTILVGPNGGGKSTILEAIALIAQSVDRKLQLEGNLVEFSELQDIAHKGELDRWLSFELEFDNHRHRYSLQLRPDTGEGQQTITDENGDFIRVKLEGDRRLGLKISVEDSVGSGTPKRADHLLILFAGLFVGYRQDGTGGLAPFSEAKETERIVHEIASDLQAEDRVFLLSALRGAVPFSTGTGASPKWVGSRGEDLLSILAFVESPTYEDVQRKIAKWLSKFGLRKLKAGIKGSNLVAGDYVDSDLKAPLNLALASYGAKQILAPITQLFWSPPHSLVMIEEPESSLHPQAQVSLIEMFADAIRDTKQVFVTTHSSLMLLAIGEAVKKGVIRASDIAVYDVSKASGGTRTRGLSVTRNGYLKGWVPSFAKVERRLLNGWVENLPEA